METQHPDQRAGLLASEQGARGADGEVERSQEAEETTRCPDSKRCTFSVSA